jgi:N-acetylglucosaminyldiphosphoundecaprenol N-acetyl-beta-D-mannosaminyltransferase
MIKKIDIMGILLDDYTVREALHQIESFSDDNVLRSIESISMQMLMEAEKDEELRNAISSLDLAIVGQKEILEVAGVGTMQRIKETEENDFFYEFLKRLERNHKRLFLLGETEEKNNRIKEKLIEQYPQLSIVGEYALENCIGDQAAVINEMNAATPDLVLSALPSPTQEHFFWEHKDKINARIWYGVGDVEIDGRTGVKKMVTSLLHRGRLKSSIEKYEKNNMAL